MFDEIISTVEEYNLHIKFVFWAVISIVFWYFAPMAHFSTAMRIILTIAMMPLTWIIIDFVASRG